MVLLLVAKEAGVGRGIVLVQGQLILVNALNTVVAVEKVAVAAAGAVQAYLEQVVEELHLLLEEVVLGVAILLVEVGL